MCIRDSDNPHDPEAVAIYYGKTKLGYVPGNEVGPLSLMMYYGHEDVFEAVSYTHLDVYKRQFACN